MDSNFPTYTISTIPGFSHEDLLVSRFETYSRTHKHLHNPHRHNFYHLVLFTEGSGNHAIDFRNFPVKPYQIYFMIPGQVHSWNFNGPVDGYVVNFSEAFFQAFLLRQNYLEIFPFFNGTDTDSVFEIPQEYRKKITDLFDEILKEIAGNQNLSVDFVRILLLEIFILISRFILAENTNLKSPYNYTLLKTFRQLIERNFKTLKLPKEYAELLYVTPNHLNALCNDMLGISAGEVIRNRVMLEAKRLLVNMNLTISEISLELNFNDNSYFTKFFKKYSGVTPEEFRKNTLK